MADVSPSVAHYHTNLNMSRRLPLSTLQNGPNSPRGSITSSAVKRSRAHTTSQRDAAFGQATAPKKPVFTGAGLAVQAAPRQLQTQTHGLSIARNASTKLSTDQYVLHESQRAAVNVKDENTERLRQWRSHYRQVFPQYVFYFDNISTETRTKFSKQIAALGSREEVFFSATVTHVVTTRSLTVTSRDAASSEPLQKLGHSQSTILSSQPLFINPLLLERHIDNSHTSHGMINSRFNTQALPVRKPGLQTAYEGFELADGDFRKQNTRKFDILAKAKEYDMKIWNVEKFQRMMSTMFGTSASIQQHHQQGQQAGHASHTTRQARDPDLTDLLKNERLNGPLDRDRSVATKDLLPFKGPYVYIRDASGTHKAIMMKEFPKVTKKEDGTWPQFRSVSGYRCPFIVEGEEDIRQRRLGQARLNTADARAQLATKRQASKGNTLLESTNAVNLLPPPVPTAKDSKDSQELLPPLSRCNSNTTTELFGVRLPANHTAFQVQEPLASGLQRSHVTSAIRSQMISSTADMPGARSGTTKEMFDLQRKVLDRSRPSSVRTTSNLSGMRNVSGVSEGAARGGTKRKIEEVVQDGELETHQDKRIAKPAMGRAAATQGANKDSKQGYCENCKLKFENFDDHIESREHRKFALTMSNWVSLDKLLIQLGRKPKQDRYSISPSSTFGGRCSSDDVFI